MYADGGDGWLDEDAPIAGGGSTATALTAEANADALFAGDSVVLRFGLFVGPDSSLTLGGRRSRARGALAERRPARRVPADPLARRRRHGGRRGARRAGRDLQRGRRRPADARGDRRGARRRRRARQRCGRRWSTFRPSSSRWRARSACRAPAARGDRLDAAGARRHRGVAPDHGAGAGGVTAEQRFARARPRLLRLAYSQLGDLGEAEDVVQEAWLRLESAGVGDDRRSRRLADDRGRPARARHGCGRLARAARRTSARGCRSRWSPPAARTPPTA